MKIKKIIKKMKKNEENSEEKLRKIRMPNGQQLSTVTAWQHERF